MTSKVIKCNKYTKFDILIEFYRFLINNENPIIIKIDKIVFLKISLDNFILILVPKYCPIKAGAVTTKLIDKS